LFEKPTLNVRQTRWLEFLSEYEFDIKNIKGKKNKVVDALNRRVHEMHATTISMCRMYLKDKILETLTIYPHCVQFKEFLQQNNVKQKYKYYKLEEEGIFLYGNKFYVPNSQELRNLVLNEKQNVSYARHLGYQKTIAIVRG
jgi:hypothetical protein